MHFNQKRKYVTLREGGANKYARLREVAAAGYYWVSRTREATPMTPRDAVLFAAKLYNGEGKFGEGADSPIDIAVAPAHFDEEEE